MNKKGLSQVVTTVLIILLVLAAVVIIWAFVRPTLTQAGEQISADCFTLDIQTLSCTSSTGAGNSTDVRIKRNAGAGDLQGVRLILTNDAGEAIVSDEVALNELETQSYNVTGVNATTVNVAGLVGTNSRPCNPQYSAVSCVFA